MTRIQTHPRPRSLASLTTLLCLLSLSCGVKQRDVGAARVQVSIASALTQQDINKVTVTVSATGMTSISVDLTNTNGRWAATFGSIPAGTGRTFLAEAFDATNTVRYRGSATGVTITRGTTVPVFILAEQTTPPPPFGNAAPLIDSVVASDSATAPGGTIHFAVTAHDPDGPADPITYAWTVQICSNDPTPVCADDGALAAGASAATDWTAAPDAADGVRVVTITVTDSHRAAASVSFGIGVSATLGAGTLDLGVTFNTWPVAQGMTAAPTQAAPGTAINLTVTAQDPDGDALSYAWSSPDCPDGSFAPQSGAFVAGATPIDPQTGATVWTSAAPVNGNQCTLIAAIDDGRLGTNTATVVIYIEPPTQVDFAPQIDTFSQSAPGSDGTPVTLSLTAHDPDPADSVTFVWTMTGGAIDHQDSAGNSATTTATWTPDLCAPASPISATVTASDSRGGSTSHTFTLDVPTLCPPSCVEYNTAGKPSGVYVIDPGATNGAGAFKVYCDNDTNGGGWAIVAKLGESTNPRTTFDQDVGLANLLDPGPPGSLQDDHFNLADFAGYQNVWTVRVTVDTSNDGSHFQSTFWRPADGQTVDLAELGQNWKPPSTVRSRVQWLNTPSSTTVSLPVNTTWLTVGPNDLDTDPDYSMYLFGFRDLNHFNDCLGGDGQTLQCHAPAGMIINQTGDPLTGTNSAALAMGDLVTHTWGKRAIYSLKKADVGGAP